jgi:predicted DNA-binding transcriptional regulator AlpA
MDFSVSTPTTTSRAIGAIPEAWPLLMSREQVCAYLGMSADTLKRVLPVPALALGAKLLRWRRTDIDEWAAGLPARLTGSGAATENPPPPTHQIAGEERRFSALERASQRASRKPGKPTWKMQKARSRSSNG